MGISFEECREAEVDFLYLPVAEWALDQIRVPEGKSVEVLTVGHDPAYRMYVHFKPLSIEALRDYKQWADDADCYVDLTGSGPPFGVIKLVAQKLWPGVKVYKFDCLCCSGDDLVKGNSCGYCGLLDEHEKGCPALIPVGDGVRSMDHPQMQEHTVFADACDATRNAKSLARVRLWFTYVSPRTSPTWKLGYCRAKARSRS